MIELLFMLASGIICECSACICEDVSPPDTSECASPLTFTDGTLWKPKGDHTGKLVVLLAPQHDYETCSAKLKSGAFDELEYTGRSNGDRQTFRGRTATDYAGVRKDGGLLCFTSGGSECFFPIPGKPRNRHE